MAHGAIMQEKEPVRLFQSDFLEFFTHISPVAVLVIWLPVVVFFFVRAVVTLPAGISPAIIPAGFVAGLFIWTLTEYVMHRFVFHFPPRNAWQERISFLFHGVHHAQPTVKTRLVMPPAVSIPLALVFYALYFLVFDVLLGIGWWVPALFAGFLIGYLAYDMIHYGTHHFPVRGYFRFLKIYHMNHHFKTPNQRFGVSSPAWDVVFGTRPLDDPLRLSGNRR